MYTTYCDGASLLFSKSYEASYKHETLLMETALAQLRIGPLISQNHLEHPSPHLKTPTLLGHIIRHATIFMTSKKLFLHYR